MRFLFVKTELGWPRYSGHDVHAYAMMQALAARGHEVALLTAAAPSAEALDGLQLVCQTVLPAAAAEAVVTDDTAGNEPAVSSAGPLGRRLQERFRSYWGIEHSHIRFVRDHAERLAADAVVVVGMEVLPYLTLIRRQQRIWYAADEWVWHHLSLLKMSQADTWGHLRNAALLGAYERSFASVIDRAWVVSAADQRALRWVAGLAAVDVIPNGVDATAFAPVSAAPEPLSCAFWGNLSFQPNEQALAWFCEQVWPLVRERHAAARFNIYGFQPSPKVQQLGRGAGIRITPDVPDIGEAVSRQAVVVLPFRSGGGVKNKLLEAAALAKPIVCSPRSCNGLTADDELPFEVVAESPAAWAAALSDLWADAQRCEALGRRAREWVLAHHSWQAAADRAVAASNPRSSQTR